MKPMLASPVAEVPATADWIIEGKIDGWRGVAFIDDDGVQRVVKVLAGRNSADYTAGMPHIVKALERFPAGTTLDGELVCTRPGAHSGTVRSAVAHQDTDLMFVVFDILRVEGPPDEETGAPTEPVDITRLPLVHRKRMLEAHRGYFDEDCMAIIPYAPAGEEQHAALVRAGLEGSVSKRLDSFYRPGKRSKDWQKVKVEGTVDALILGTELGKGKHNQGQPAAFVVRMRNGVETTAKIPTDEMVDDVTKHPERYVDHVVELKHNGEYESGKIRHPIVFRMRHDHDAATLFAEED